MTSPFRVIPWIILLMPFVVSAFFYDSAANEVLVTRSFFGNEEIFAPKSLLTVFRVPLIEVICGALIETARPKQSDDDWFSIWNILLYAVAFKSLFQVCEFISTSVFFSPDYAALFFYLTLLAVAAGICLAFIKGRKIFSISRREGWKLSGLKKALLGILLLAYFTLAFVPAFIYKAA